MADLPRCLVELLKETREKIVEIKKRVKVLNIYPEANIGELRKKNKELDEARGYMRALMELQDKFFSEDKDKE